MRRVVFILIGIGAIVCAFFCATADIGSFEMSQVYGGDAYTGIQQAAAQTANNVKDLTELVSFFSASLLGVIGLICIAYGIFSNDYKKQLEAINANLAGACARGGSPVRTAAAYTPAPQQNTGYTPVPQQAPVNAPVYNNAYAAAPAPAPVQNVPTENYPRTDV